MKKVYGIWIGVFLLSVILVLFLGSFFDVTDTYQKKLQQPFFSGFLTIAGFLLSTKTFLLQRLKDDLFGSSWYQERVIKAQAVRPEHTLYGPLVDLGSFLIFTVLSSIVTAAAQFSIGFLSFKWASAICIGLGFSTLVMVGMCWFYVRLNLNTWFEHLKKQQPKPPSNDP